MRYLNWKQICSMVSYSTHLASCGHVIIQWYPSTMWQCFAGFKLQGAHESEQVTDHCTIDTYDSMQSTEDAVTVINPGLRFDSVRCTAIMDFCQFGYQSLHAVFLLQEAVVLDPYAQSIVGRQQYGQLAQVPSLQYYDLKSAAGLWHVDIIKMHMA